MTGGSSSLALAIIEEAAAAGRALDVLGRKLAEMPPDDLVGVRPEYLSALGQAHEGLGSLLSAAGSIHP